jgi:hypothetical protein
MNATYTSLETSFSQLFGQQRGNLSIHRIEIPLIQRDYAQGRPGDTVKRIRDNFLDDLCAALIPEGTVISLDFVYGDVVNGTLHPLDGQQRLTTLFLLHCYLAWRAGVSIKNQPWAKFSYATRPSARLFCERLTEFQLAVREIAGDIKLSRWLTDQDWYLYTWQHDPTIQSMLVMLDALHKRYRCSSDEDCAAAWERLTHAQTPAISFHLLPMAADRLTDDPYIKMNSRGKPLTAFENFKANFESLLKNQSLQNAEDFAKKVDAEWANTLWPYRGSDNLIDDEFMRYFRFVTEVCAWQSGVSFSEKSRTDDLAEQVYAGNEKSTEHLEFLFQAFDVWHQKDIKAEFDSLMTATPAGPSVLLALFNAFKNTPKDESPVDLFSACCRHYGKAEWTLAHTLLLYAVLLSRIHHTANFPRQLRILRNLIEASGGGEIRDQKMPELLEDVKSIVVVSTLLGVTAFNQAQIVNENEKAVLLTQHPALQTALHQLEDHSLLHGCLATFDLEPAISLSVFTQRADAFLTLFNSSHCWPELTGALLAIGDYSRQEKNRWTGYHFADFGASASKASWRDLFRGKKEKSLVSVLMSLLDQVATAKNDLTCLQTIQQNFLQQCEAKTEMDWRYYFVKYAAMREGTSGRYAINSNGYGICMLDNTSMRGYYRDPYLLAMWRASGGGPVADPWPKFSGYETEPRRMVLKNSGIQMQCVDRGLQITNMPADPVQKATFDQVCAGYPIDPNGLYVMPQNNGVDSRDRVALGGQFLRNLVDAGL